MNKILIRNATIINEGDSFTGSVLIEGDCINKVYRNNSTIEVTGEINEIDATGRLLLPGVIDDQVHFREPGLTHKGTIYSESRAAAAGGITSFMEMPNTIPQTISAQALREKQMIAARDSLVNYSFYFGATNDNIEEIRALDEKNVCGIKVFMGSSTGNMLVDNEETLRQIFSVAKIPVTCHCEDEQIIKDNLAAYTEEYGDDLPVAYHPLIRSREACYKSSSFAVSLAKEYGTRLHILHLSTEEEINLFDNSLSLADKKITAEVCIHHLWFDDSDYHNMGTSIKWNPAIKKASDRRALIKGVRDNFIDIIATDHAPHLPGEKDNVYTRSASGGPMVQHSLVAMMELWHNNVISIEKIVEKMCHNPAILFGIEKRGFIREGYKADLCLVNPSSPWTVSNDNILYKCGWSPFEGYTFRSFVEHTWVNGHKVWDGNKIIDSKSSEMLSFKR